MSVRESVEKRVLLAFLLIMKSAKKNTLFFTRTLLLGETHVGHSLQKWISHKVVGSTCVSSNKIGCVRKSVEKRVLLIFSFVIGSTRNTLFFTLFLTSTL